ncbi:elongation of very long chain fatty acids protein 7 [Plutella xylostella]|uniref:elongation of very long chain fatty acids protein 7 n=1 Tax=Plutella xylostella TaxID=51655 RepID=UPI0020328B31|nr:elongation of very long chain fatty acids protein 7 [Plutella xylostella]
MHIKEPFTFLNARWCFPCMGVVLPQGRLEFLHDATFSDPNEVLFVMAMYLVFLIKVFPKFMEKRTPFSLKTFVFFLNIFKACNSSILVWRFFRHLLSAGLFPLGCYHDYYKIHPIGFFYYKFMATKVLDLADSWILALQKRTSDVTFLHVYNRVFLVLVSWTCMKYDPSDHWALFAMLNSAVQVLGYVATAAAVLGPRVAKYVVWKDNMLLLQTIHYMVIFVHMLLHSCFTNCPMDTVVLSVCGLNAAAFVVLLLCFVYSRGLPGQTNNINSINQ